MKLNKFYSVFSCLLIAVLLISCQDDGKGLLDKEKSSDITEDMVFTNAQYTYYFLNGIYQRLNSGFFVFGEAGYLGNAVDEGLHKASWDNAEKMALCSWNETSYPINYNPWSKNYQGIRAANRFMAEIDNVPNSDEPVMNDAIRVRMKAEARFLRAMFHYELLKFYGGVPIQDKVLTAADEEELKKPRSTFDETVDFICKEALLAEKDLPHSDEYDTSDFGRITKGACYALISRVRLMAASPLYNDPQQPEDTPFHGKYSADKWRLAAEAARDFIQKTRGYELHQSTNPARYGDYEDFFIRRYSPEVILSYQSANDDPYLGRISLNGQLFGYGAGHQNVNNFPMLNAVADYEVVKIENNNIVSSHYIGMEKLKDLYDTNSIDSESGFDPQNPYLNRDPRFYQSIYYNQSPWPARNGKIFEIWTLEGGTMAQSGLHEIHRANAAFTFPYFYIRKFTDAWADQQGWNNKRPNVTNNFPIFRYAEILLNYAEAVNQAFDNPDATPPGYPMSARDAVNLVRRRAKFPPLDIVAAKWPTGMPKNVAGQSLPDLPLGLNKTDMNERIVRERRIELYQEEHRYWDLNRWKKREPFIAYGQTIVKKTNGKFVFNYTEVMERKWYDKFYFFPILVSEKEKVPAWEQAPGW